MNARETLKKYWGHEQFRPLQEEIISSVMSGTDTLAIMPTGGGKSVCFQVPALMLEGTCIVVTPLIALMKDQVNNLTKLGISALAIHSGMKYKQVKQGLDKTMHGDFKFLYVSPERLETSLFKEFLPFLKISLLAVDEAHCISQWGYDFRPAYLKISSVREILTGVPVLALTASATRKVQADIGEKLHFRPGHRLFEQSYDRPNLSYSVFIPPSKENKIEEIFNKVPGSGLAYCRSRKRTKELANHLNIHRQGADFYHAGLSSNDRNTKQDRWIKSHTRIICCTNAFGMGIDKPDVRTVVHFDLPDALENYYQEAGRAGRDGKRAYAVLLFHPQEIEELKLQMKLKFPPVEDIRNVYSLLCSFLQLPAGKGYDLSFPFEIGKFLEVYKLNPILVTSVLKTLEQEGIMMLSDQLFTPSTCGFLASKATLENLEKDYPKYTAVIKGLLRSYEGIFDQPSFIDEYILARFIGKRKEEVMLQLSELHQMKIVEYEPRGDIPKIYFLADRVPAADLIINEKNMAMRKAAYEKRLDAMIQYATQTQVCRSVFINNYFDGKPVQPCGICDLCIAARHRQLSATEMKRIVEVLAAHPKLHIDDVESRSNVTKKKLEEALHFLRKEETVTIDEQGMVYYRQPKR